LDNTASNAITGTYTGDGALAQAITGIGFRPKWVMITDRQTTNNAAVEQIWTTDVIIDDNIAGGAIVAGSSRFITGGIVSLDSDGFTVGDRGANRNPNTSGQIYNFIAIG
jgi:hypothetical protein